MCLLCPKTWHQHSQIFVYYYYFFYCFGFIQLSEDAYCILKVGFPFFGLRPL